MEKLETLRSAGLLERYHITRCDLGLDSCVVTSARYVSRSGLALDDRNLHLALKKVILDHPALSTQIVGVSSGNPRFVRMRSIDLAQVVEDHIPTPDLDEAFIHYLARPIKTGTLEPLWRLVRFNDGTLIFAFHHAIGDGQSGPAFHKALLKALNELPQSSTILELPSSFLPPVEKLTDIGVSCSKLVHELYGLLAPASWKDSFDAWTGNVVVTDPTLHTNVRLWELNERDTRRLLTLCRQHGCTLTAFLYILTVEALSYLITTISPANLEKYKTLSTNVAVSLRRFTGTSPSEICDQSSKYHCYIPVTTGADDSLPEHFPWTRAAEFAATLHTNLGIVRQDIGAMGYLFGHFREYFNGMLGKKREGTFTISNIGPFPSDGKAESGNRQWYIDKMFFAQCDATVGSAIKINVVGAPNGSLGTSFTWGQGTMDDNVAESFVDMVKDWTCRVIIQSDSA